MHRRNATMPSCSSSTILLDFAMPTTLQLLTDYPDALLEVIIELRNAVVDVSGNRRQILDRLAAELTSPTSVQVAYQELVEDYPDVARAVDMLLKEGGDVREAAFSREFGSIRQMGPAKLQREEPYLHPIGIAELLYYYGFIGRTFSGAGQTAHNVIYLPSDIMPWLPRSLASLPEGALAIQPSPTPQRSRMVAADDAFLEDAGSLLGFLHSDVLHLTPQGPNADDIDRLVTRLQFPFDSSMPDQETRLALLLHEANQLGWLRRTQEGVIALTGNRVRDFLDKTRAEQRQALFDAWRSSTEWNDLLKVPGLEFAPGSVRNDPLQNRLTLLNLLSRISPTAWYRISTLSAAVRDRDPAFLRPAGHEGEWTPLHSNTKNESEGFDPWDAVEGAWIESVVRGPLHWHGAVDLAEPTAGDDWVFSLTTWGARWLGMDVEQPTEGAHRSLVVHDDFTVTLPLGASISDRFRVERFAQWQASFPQFVYQINQRSLKRAQDSGVAASQILDFLSHRTRTLPDKVVSALQRYAQAPRSSSVDRSAKRV